MATPMPISVRLTILVVVLSEHTILFMIPTFVSFMVAGFMPDIVDRSQISSKSGYIEGIAGTLGFVGCLFWGAISDKIGRKPALIIVLSGMIVASLGFGLSPSYEVCLVWRGVAGIMAGVVPLSKSLIQDISDESNIAILYSYLGMGYGFASILGPFIGGFLSRPTNYFPVLSDTVFDHFPYFLPMICHSTIASIAIIMVILYIKPKNSSTPTAVKTEHKSTDLLKNKNYLMGLAIFILVGVIQFGYRIIMACWVKVPKEDGGLGFENEMVVGIMNSLSGIIVTGYHFFAVPYMSKKLGVIKSGIFIVVKLIPVVVIVSFCNGLFDVWGNWVFWAVIIVANGLCIALSTACISFISIGISNSVDIEILGLATGITQSIIACVRGVSIAGFGIIFAAAQGWEIGFPFDLHFPFFFLALILVLIYTMMQFGLSKEIETRKKKKDIEIPLIEKSKI